MRRYKSFCRNGYPLHGSAADIEVSVFKRSPEDIAEEILDMTNELEKSSQAGNMGLQRTKSKFFGNP